jgi:hypothetical protein
VATRTLSRRALRDRNHAAEVEAEGSEDDADGADAPLVRKKKTKAKVGLRKLQPTQAPAQPRVGKKKVVKVAPLLFARWAVCDNGAKRIAVFSYNDRAAAEAKLLEIRERKPGAFYLLLEKEPCDPPTDEIALA